MKRTVSLIGAAALGAGISYLADPVLGKRRRALARDAVVHGAKVLRRAIDIAVRDTAHRLKGFLEVSKQAFKHEHVSDEVLADRIRTAVGSVSSHPNVEVIVEEGCVTLLGPVAAHEELPVLEAAQSVRGVRAIVNRMQAYRPAAGMPTQAPRERELDIFQRHWAPATRVVVGSIGASMLVGSTKMPTPGRVALGAGGLALIARAATNMEFERLLGFKAGPRPVGIRKGTFGKARPEAA